jgi:hypothetical protein
VSTFGTSVRTRNDLRNRVRSEPRLQRRVHTELVELAELELER